MTGAPNSGMQVERVLEDLIARLSRTEPSKEVRAALIEARRLRSVTLTWTAIPPPPDARREMLTKVMGLVARVGVGAAPRPSAEVRAEFASMTPPPPEGGRSRATEPARQRLNSPLESRGRIPSPIESSRSRAPTPPPSSMPPVSFRDGSARRPSSLPPGRDSATFSLPPLGAPRAPHVEDADSPLSSRTPPREPSPPPPRPPSLPPPESFDAGARNPSEKRARITEPAGARENRSPSPAPFRRSPSAQSFPTPVPHSITAINASASGAEPPAPKRTFGSGGTTQTNLTRPLRSTVGHGVHLVRPQATAWQGYPRVAGAKLKLLWRDAETGSYTALLHLAPGTVMPKRRHAQLEEMLLVEGSATIGTWDVRPGEYCRAEAGSVHDPIKTEEGCTFFVTGSEHDEILEDGAS